VTASRRIIAVAAVVIIIAVAAILLLRRPSPSSSSLKISGTVEATTVTVGFKVNGRIKERPVDEGATVKVGQLLARLETDDLQQEVALRRAELEAATAVLAELKAGSRSEEIAQARAALDRAEAEENRLTADFARQEELYRREVISTHDFEAARSAYQMAKAQARELRERLGMVRKGPRIETIRQARARVGSARAALELASNRLNDATLFSPTAGSVLAKHQEPGELVNAGTPVLTIGDLESVWIRAYIPETDLGRVKLGQTARITGDTFPGRAYQGTVSFISPEAEFTPKNVQTEKERVKLVFRIKITVPNPQHELKPGMPVNAELTLK